MTMVRPVIFNLSFFIGIASSARILCLFPVPFYSHQSVLNVFTKELSRRGHELVVIAAANHSEKNVTEINTKNISEAVWNQEFTSSLNSFYEPDIEQDLISILHLSLHMLYSNAHAIFSKSEVQDLIRNEHEKFDLILIEECSPPNIIIAARFDAPIIYVTSYYSNHIGLQVTGSETNPLYHADINFGKILWNSPIWERMYALIYSIRLNFMFWHFEQFIDDMTIKYIGANTPTFQELRNNVQMMFINTYQFWDFSRPVPPSVMYTGGIHLKNPKPLPDDLKNYVDSATNGVIYMSFGSKFKSSDLPEKILRIITKAFASLPYKVIWKIDGELFGEQTNIRVESWLPQNDLLHHPSVKAFITHAGLQSTDEAIAAGVPLVALPLYVDQFTNANNYVLHGIGIKLNIKALNEKEFRAAIIEVAENESYRNNIKRLGSIMKQHRAGSLDKMMHYIDYVLKHGKINFHSPSANLFEEFYQFDVFLPVIVMLLAASFFLIILLMRIFLKMMNLMKFVIISN